MSVGLTANRGHQERTLQDLLPPLLLCLNRLLAPEVSRPEGLFVDLGRHELAVRPLERVPARLELLRGLPRAQVCVERPARLDKRGERVARVGRLGRIGDEERRVGAELVQNELAPAEGARCARLVKARASRRAVPRSREAKTRGRPGGRHDLDGVARELAHLGRELLEPVLALVEVVLGDFLALGEVEVRQLRLDLVQVARHA